ncbi:MAG: hypothetical protein IMW89_20815 [Ktedonobacteraceae bacterium]|nr:hypothetical protein [Ktedonobacteraceae bacterium]
MFKPLKHERVPKQPSSWFALLCLAVFFLAACGSSSSPTPSASATTPTPFKVTSVDLVVNPASIADKPCGSSASFTYTATFHIPANTAGGSIQFEYTLNNGRSTAPASVKVGPGETAKTFTFTSSGTLPPDHTYPGLAGVHVTSPNAVNSPMVKPAGTCVESSAFKVTSIDMTVSPKSLTGLKCSTSLTVTYTATFHIAPNSPGGTIQFFYTVNNGRSSAPASVTVGPGETTATYTFTWSGALPADHVYPGQGGVMTTSPNEIISRLVKPEGQCA